MSGWVRFAYGGVISNPANQGLILEKDVIKLCCFDVFLFPYGVIFVIQIV
jgi:hypothetical protein